LRGPVLPSVSGFSLVEVALSLAILAVGMVGVLALLPVGLDSARQVHNETVASQIVRGVIADFATNGYGSQSYGALAGVPDGGTLRTEYFTTEGVLTNQAAGYFRVNYIKGYGTPSGSSCRYFLTLFWPAGASENSPTSQSRTFVTEVVRRF
jgi:prepilin-type N-terminal cleavage/methylation domain-containing protein